MYNTEEYIKKCICSIYENNSLNFNDFEVIVINDGSTDNSQTIVRNLMVKYKNITLINKDNGGQSSARNSGFKLAKGDYIFCLDSDDFLDADLFVEGLNYCLINDLDLLPIHSKLFLAETGVFLNVKDNYKRIEGTISGVDFLNKFVVSGAMCRYFYKTSCIRNNNLYLLEGVTHEDEEFVTKYIALSKRVSYNQLTLYFYTQRNDSTVNNRNVVHRVKLINDLLKVVLSLNEFTLIHSEDEKLVQGVNKKIKQLIISIFLRFYNEPSVYNKDHKELIVKKLKENRLYPIPTKGLMLKHKLICFLINNFKSFYF